jgi:Putative peptidoglycan binding domain
MVEIVKRIFQNLPAEVTMFKYQSLVALAALAATAVPSHAQQSVPALYDGSNTTFTITPGSILRVGDRLTSRIVVTMWQGGQIKGVGTCSQDACPVLYDGQNLFARRSRLRLPGGSTAGTSGSQGSSGAISRTLRRGDQGDDVLRLQDALNRSGATITVDRNFGRGTRSAVESFQRSKGLKVDGVAGPDTLRALGV